MTSYAKVKWNIIEKWNSDAKYDNEYLIQMALDNGVEIRNKRADRKSIVAKVVDSVIKSDIEKGDCTITEWGTFSQEQTSFEKYMGSLGVPEPELDLDIDPDAHEHEHEHDDGTVHSHPHSHDKEHSHDHEEESIIPVEVFNNKQEKHEEEHPNFKKMSKKALDKWAEERGIILDRRKTKAHMIAELNKQL